MNTLNSGTRLGTMIFDHITMIFIVGIVAAPGMVYDILQMVGHPGGQPKLFLGNYYVNIFAFSLYFNKDIFLGRSIAKRTLKLQIVDIKTNKPANPLKCLVRNLTIILWPIEVIASLVNNERRIGDYIAGTGLTTYDPEKHNSEINWVLVLLAVLASALFTYLALFYPMELFF
jgi:uncharacterized RDD family membrane protein YckC